MSYHREQLNKHKLTMLRKAASEVERTGVNKFSIQIFKDNINDYNNAQKMRYHGLITHVQKHGVFERGSWLITRQGWEFLEGKKELPKWVETENNHIVNHAPETVGVRDVYHGSEVVQTTFNYTDGLRQWVAPLNRPSMQASLL